MSEPNSAPALNVQPANICWHRQCKFEDRCRLDHDSDHHFSYGRCRSGRRWFWTVYYYKSNAYIDPVEFYGWTDTEQAALDAATAAIITQLSDGERACVSVFARAATDKLKQLNTEKRAARPAPDGTGSKLVEYLYGYTRGGEDSDGYPVRFRILKKTAKRIYYLDDEEPADEQRRAKYAAMGIRDLRDGRVGFVDRQKLEEKGNIYNTGRHRCYADFHLYASLEGLLSDRYRHPEPQADIAQLKAAMAAAHPDGGGTSAQFIEARRAYVDARRRARVAA
jgi:hypothetical protein